MKLVDSCVASCILTGAPMYNLNPVFKSTDPKYSSARYGLHPGFETDVYGVHDSITPSGVYNLLIHV